jgi:decaprenylphospho-beta-D-erythro-pentofuranosid-2-ulose 2-reductase
MMDALGHPQSVFLAGGTSEIGLAIVRELMSTRIERLVLAGRNHTDMTLTAASFAHNNRKLDVLDLDISHTELHEICLDQAFGGGDIDVAIMAIGVLGNQAEDELDVKKAMKVIRVNSSDSIELTMRVFERMAKQGHGTLVVLSSIAAVRPRRANFIYGAGKAGLDAFTQGLIELGNEVGVKVILVRPGFVRTKMTAGMEDAPFSVYPHEVAADTVDAIRKNKSIIYSPAQVGAVAVALRNLPRPLLRKLPR